MGASKSCGSAGGELRTLGVKERDGEGESSRGHTTYGDIGSGRRKLEARRRTNRSSSEGWLQKGPENFQNSG